MIPGTYNLLIFNLVNRDKKNKKRAKRPKIKRDRCKINKKIEDITTRIILK